MNRRPVDLPPPDLPVESAVPAPVTQPAEAVPGRPGRPHLVVVRCRASTPADKAPDATPLITRFWHPRDQRWSLNSFESLEHALRLFVDESGWSLLQQQQLDGPLAHELIFEARREDFTGPTTEEILREVGLEPD
jgi:hypothetical protein